MNLAVLSHKPCWASSHSPSGYATDGGFPFQIRAISELFDTTTLVVPVYRVNTGQAELPLTGQNLQIVPLSAASPRKFWRRVTMPFWLLRNGPILARETLAADAVHAPIPGDVGTYGMLLALILKKPLFVRHCGNWLEPRTTAEHFWKWFIERFAGNRNVMLATGGSAETPSKRNVNVRWIFSTSLCARDLSFPRQTSSDWRAPRLIIVCRQEQLKGTAKVIHSLPLILRDFPAATLHVVGDGRDLGKFRTLAEESGVSKYIVFHGYVHHDKVIELLRQATLFCYPTAASEGFPKVVLEALATGLPIVTTPVSVLPQLIATGCGVLIEDTSPQAIAKAVKHCLEPENYLVMSARAIESARNYSLENWRDTIGAWLRQAWGPLNART